MDGRSKNSGTKGNAGGGRKSAYQELLSAQWLQDVLDGKINIKDVEPIEYITYKKFINANGKIEKIKEIATRFKSGKDAIAYKVLTGNDSMLRDVLSKLIASKRDITTDGNAVNVGGFIMMPPKETK